jgi:diketogulonate reductase-like aldo/keto reductase
MKEEWLKTTSGVNMSRLIYGTAWKKNRIADLVVKAITAGFRGIDTACQPKHYSEPLAGEALQRLQDKGYKRENLFVQTKFTPLKGQDPNNIPYDEHATLEIQVVQSFQVSKKTFVPTMWIL